MTWRRLFLIVVASTAALSWRAWAQAPQSMTVSPNKATMQIGETRTFRAVGKDGRIRHNVRWGISPEHAAEIRVDGDEVSVTAREASPSVSLSATADGDSADASIEMRTAGDISAGTTIWTVSPTPGCRVAKMTQAVPSTNGPDLYVQERCTDGTMIRALTADGREMWRRSIGGGALEPANAPGPIAQGPYAGFMPNGVTTSMAASKTSGKTGEPAGEHLQLQGASVCDSISVGMDRNDALNAIAGRKVAFDARQRPSNAWTIEEEGSRCTISFDPKTGNVVKKKKTVVTD